MFNFAVGGVVAVFWQKGVPRLVTQGYLVAVSVIMAWILTKLPEWTSWALLIALALYDLCAVLTPCGPLKALVKLAQERQDPIPGLLYEVRWAHLAWTSIHHAPSFSRKCHSNGVHFPHLVIFSRRRMSGQRSGGGMTLCGTRLILGLAESLRFLVLSLRLQLQLRSRRRILLRVQT